jgi:hypothetical protein
MLKKTSQFSGKAKPNTQHLNLSESFCWVSLGLWLGFLTSTQPTVVSLGLWLGFLTSTQPCIILFVVQKLAQKRGQQSLKLLTPFGGSAEITVEA